MEWSLDTGVTVYGDSLNKRERFKDCYANSRLLRLIREISGKTKRSLNIRIRIGPKH